MRTLTGIVLTSGLLIVASLAAAQRPGGGPGPRSSGADDLVARMMEFDKDKDGSLSRAEITDERLLRLFDRADGDKNGTVTKAELTDLAAKDAANDRGGFPGGGGPGGFMGGGPPRPGEVLSPNLQQRLGLTAEQKAKVEALQAEVDAMLATILDDEQMAQLKEMRQRGPGGGGPRGGGGRPGDGGPPPPPRGD